MSERSLDQIGADLRQVARETAAAEQTLKELRARNRDLVAERDTVLATRIVNDTSDAEVVRWHGGSEVARTELTRRVQALHPEVDAYTHWTHVAEQPTTVRMGAVLRLDYQASTKDVQALAKALVEFADRFCPDLPQVPAEDPQAGMVYADLLHHDDGHLWKVLYEPSLDGRAVLVDGRSKHTPEVAGSLVEVLGQAHRIAWYRNGPTEEDDT